MCIDGKCINKCGDDPEDCEIGDPLFGGLGFVSLALPATCKPKKCDDANDRKICAGAIPPLCSWQPDGVGRHCDCGCQPCFKCDNGTCVYACDMAKCETCLKVGNALVKSCVVRKCGNREKTKCRNDTTKQITDNLPSKCTKSTYYSR